MAIHVSRAELRGGIKADVLSLMVHGQYFTGFPAVVTPYVFHNVNALGQTPAVETLQGIRLDLSALKFPSKICCWPTFFFSFFCNRRYSLLSFGGPQLYNSEAWLFAYDSV